MFDFKSRRRTVGISIPKLATLCDCSPDHLWLIERGYVPSKQMQDRIDEMFTRIEQGERIFYVRVTV